MTPTPSGKRKMILDVDTGIDDALALAYLASFDDVEILGVIGTYGNVSADTAVRNTAYVLERLGFRDVPVMCGSTRPSWAAAFIPDAGCAQFHGTDGLGGFGPSADCAVGRHTSVCDDSNIQTLNPAPNVSDSSGLDVRAMRGLISVGGYDVHDPHANPAADSFSLSFTACDAGGDNDCEDRSHSPVALPDGVRFLIDAVRFYGSDVTVVATGPLTDVDAALAAAPDITSRLRLVMMGGTLTQEGNCWDATAETNIIQLPGGRRPRVPFRCGCDDGRTGRDASVPVGVRRDRTVASGRIAIAGWRRADVPCRYRRFFHRGQFRRRPPTIRSRHAIARSARRSRSGGSEFGGMFRSADEGRNGDRRFSWHARPHHRRSGRTD